MKAWWWGLCCVLLFCGTVSAHDCDSKAIRKEMKCLKAEIVALKSRVDSLEKYVVRWDNISTAQNLDYKVGAEAYRVKFHPDTMTVPAEGIWMRFGDRMVRIK